MFLQQYGRNTDRRMDWACLVVEKVAHLRGDIDIYYCKDGKISENWCFIDLPYWLKEQGLDIFERTASICNPQN